MPNKAGMLGARGQKILKGLHVTFVACSLGGLLSMLVLLLLKQPVHAGENLFLMDWSIYQLFHYAVNYSFYGVVLTGLIFSLFTRWGFFTHHWITAKWVGVLLLFVLVWVSVGPAIHGMVALADAGLSLSTARAEYLDYTGNGLLYILIEGVLFVVLVFISVLKPWGMRKRPFAVHRKVMLAVVGALVVMMGVFGVINAVTLQKYRNMEIGDSDLSSLADGAYHGEATFGGFTYSVQVTVLDHAITDVKVLANRKSAYARFAEGVILRVLAAQNANVDAITGATTTSKCLMKAVGNALSHRTHLK